MSIPIYKQTSIQIDICLYMVNLCTLFMISELERHNGMSYSNNGMFEIDNADYEFRLWNRVNRT